MPISLHPDNPHYFTFRGKPTVLVTSAEHYGAVINLDFDYRPYLDELGRRGLNQTRAFLGPYMEHPGAFQIPHNTLAPNTGRLIAPWARSGTDGYANGGAKFDLTRWDDAYFRRLKDFVRRAGEKGVVVEAVLFCTYYDNQMWNLSPLNARNNVNGIGNIGREEVLALKEEPLTAAQDAYVRKIATELAEFDNVYFEICNEPYFASVTAAFQRHVADVIVDAEKALPARRRHLIAQNIANQTAKIENPHAAVSLFNFHYAAPPDAVATNWRLDKPIGFDETGFVGIADLPYRRQAWDFLIAGGAVYNHLDYSFTTEHPDGTAEVREPTPGGGGAALRTQLAFLKRFMDRLDFVRMAPATHVIRGGVPAGATSRVLAAPGRQYAVYVLGGGQATLQLDVPAGEYVTEWVHPRLAETTAEARLSHAGGVLTLASPAYEEDIALRLVRR